MRLGELARVPAAPRDSVVLAHIDGIEVRGLEKLRALAFRGVTRTAKLDGGRRFRLVAATADDGLIMRVSRRADFPGPFALDQATSALTITRGAGAQDNRTLTIRFTTLPIH